MIWLCGCSSHTNTNNAVSIVGAWTATSLREVDTKSGSVTLDTTTQIPAAYNIVTYTSAGNYTDASAGIVNASGTYLISGSTITLTEANMVGTVSETIATLTAHALVIQRTDTTNRNPIWTTQYTFSYSR